MSVYKDVQEFHRKIGATVEVAPNEPEVDEDFEVLTDLMKSVSALAIVLHERRKTGTSPAGPDLALLRARLMIEELAETLDAMAHGNLTDIADGLADLQYVINGAAIVYGIPLEEVHHVVHSSNMSKTGQNEHSKGGKGRTYVGPEGAISLILRDRSAKGGSIGDSSGV